MNQLKTNMLRLKNWYDNQSSFKRVTITFIINWCYWFILDILGGSYIYDEAHSLKYSIFYAAWMSLTFTITFYFIGSNSKKLKKKQSESIQE